jgi:hypothetical protein
VIARVLEKVTSQNMLDFVNEAVSYKVSLLATDAWPGPHPMSAIGKNRHRRALPHVAE